MFQRNFSRKFPGKKPGKIPEKMRVVYVGNLRKSPQRYHGNGSEMIDRIYGKIPGIRNVLTEHFGWYPGLPCLLPTGLTDGMPIPLIIYVRAHVRALRACACMTESPAGTCGFCSVAAAVRVFPLSLCHQTNETIGL